MMLARDFILSEFDNYFPKTQLSHFAALPVAASEGDGDLGLIMAVLPDWASDLGIGASPSLLVPSCCVCPHSDSVWEGIDWWRAALLLMTCDAERRHESKEGPVHSYSYKLPNDIQNLWERAWVNRIFLFLRRWVAHENGCAESEMLGGLPTGILHLTHDVDYVSKTLALRLKQVAFVTYNILKCLLSGNLAGAAGLFPRLFRFCVGGGSYWQFPVIREIEGAYDASSSWNFYAGVGGFRRSATELLLDPSYRVTDKELSRQFANLRGEGNPIGLHQGFHSWKDTKRMRLEKTRLEEAVGQTVDRCRQHWLRFSFKDTWKAQEAAEFKLDTTLGFNDLPGFRNSAALRMPAWIDSEQRFSDSLETLPMILMDSHLFDYGQLEVDARKKVIDYHLDELAFVGGEATIIWHHRVFHSDYGWGDDYRYLLEAARARNLAIGANVK